MCSRKRQREKEGGGYDLGNITHSHVKQLSSRFHRSFSRRRLIIKNADVFQARSFKRQIIFPFVLFRSILEFRCSINRLPLEIKLIPNFPRTSFHLRLSFKL